MSGDLLARGWRRVHVPGQVAAQRYAIVDEVKAHGPRARFGPWPDLYESGWRRMLFGGGR